MLVQLQDQPRAVSSSVNEFVKVLIEALLIVLVVSFVSPGMHYRPQEARWYRRYHINMRPGLIVGITLPLVLAVTFLGMYHWGTGLHKISPGFLIISLGLLVDDAIIAVGMVVRKVEDRPDRADPAVGVDPLECQRREYGAPSAPDRGDGGGGGSSGHDSAYAPDFPGADGSGDHGWAAGCNCAHPAAIASHVCGLVAGPASGCACRLKSRSEPRYRGGRSGLPYLFSGAGGEIGRRTRFRS